MRHNFTIIPARFKSGHIKHGAVQKVKFLVSLSLSKAEFHSLSHFDKLNVTLYGTYWTAPIAYPVRMRGR
jgi:hypothetical protein